MSRVLDIIEMPKGYVKIGNEEMEYIDGGFYWNKYYWGVAARFSKQDCKNILSFKSGGLPIIMAVVKGMGNLGVSIATTVSNALAGISGSILLGQIYAGSLYDGIYGEFNYLLGAGVSVQY